MANASPVDSPTPVALLATESAGQQFGGEQIITTAANGAKSVYATDLDGDGDADVLSASILGDSIAWHENLGGGTFGQQQIITTAANDAKSVYATDLDGDGDADVLSASVFDSKIAWYENQGGGTFGQQQIITTAANGAYSVYAIDLDGDGDADVLSASKNDGKIAWYENQGGGTFGQQQIISTAASGARSVYAIDLDEDGDADVLSASFNDDKVAWYENQGGGTFGQQQIITTAANGAKSVYAADLDGDGDADVLSASLFDSKIAWYENQGGGTFGQQQIITTAANGAESVYAIDLDEDGDADVLSASASDDKIVWYENQGGGTFGRQWVITAAADGAKSVYATDLDGDGDADVLSASYFDDKIAWYENLRYPDADRDGLSDSVELSIGTNPIDQDTDDDGLGDGEEFNTSRVDTRWLQGSNGDYYRLAPAASWSQSSAEARAQGYELTSVQDAAETQWISDTFGEVSGGFWIGLNDFSGSFEWSDGSPVNFTQWATGEPGATFVAAFVGGPNAVEPGYWYAESAGASARMSVWESPGPNAPMTSTDPLSWDTDDDGLGDGQEDGLDAIFWDGDLDGDGFPDVGGTDPAFFVPDSDPLTVTDPLDLDSDDDGLADGAEDVDGDGAQSVGETDASLADSDLDNLTDGLELGLTTGTLDTDGNVFVADRDPATTTDPTLADTDGGGVPDGIEDQNQDGGVDTWETDPNVGADEALAFYVRDLAPGQRVRLEIYNAVPIQNVMTAYSLRGPGPTATTLGLAVNLTLPITVLSASISDQDGRVSVLGPRVPAGVALGIPVWLQAVEIPLSSTLPPRKSNSILLPIGAN